MFVRKIAIRKATGYTLWVVLLLLAACGRTPAPTPYPDAETPVATATPHARPTLPPTWTLTATYTPTDTPTITLTPTITPTFTPTATIDPETVCDEFQVYDAVEDGKRLPMNGYVSMVLSMARRDTIVEFYAIRRDTGEGILYRMPGGAPVIVQIPTSALRGPGTYDWTLSIATDNQSGLCEHGGYFVLYEAEATQEATPELTPEGTQMSEDS